MTQKVFYVVKFEPLYIIYDLIDPIDHVACAIVLTNIFHAFQKQLFFHISIKNKYKESKRTKSTFFYKKKDKESKRTKSTYTLPPLIRTRKAEKKIESGSKSGLKNT